MKVNYKFKCGDKLIDKRTKVSYIIIKVFDDYGPEDYKMALQNGIPGVPKIGNQNTRFIHFKELFKNYEPADSNIKLLYVVE